MKSFPNQFLWGVSTSSYQIEGAIHSGGRGESIWDRFSRLPGRIADGSSGEMACDHYHNWEEDLGLIQEMGAGAYRFSTAWPRIQPLGSGRFNTEGLQFYSRLVDGLLSRGIEPWLCLNHWDLPQALQEKGGWTNRDTAMRFVEYGWKVLEVLGDRVKHVIPHNEPNVLSILGHGIGIHAPGLQDASACFASAHHLNLSHGLVSRELKICQSDLQLGPVVSLQPVIEQDRDQNASERLDALWNKMFLDPVFFGTYPEILEEELKPWIHEGDSEILQFKPDFFGLNHYTVMRAQSSGKSALGVSIMETPAGLPVTDSGWEIQPEAMFKQLLEFRERYGDVPIYITENGCSSPDHLDASGEVQDPLRTQYLRDYLAAGLEAMEQGVDLRGWFFWSLLDNFEWAEGYTKRFGLIYVDYETQQRIPKDSYRFVQQLIQENTLPD